ncbi:CsiV family protein [Marinihelvus fidelis]|nr:CsiV family protein [Marinihelvus fidelis]
MLATLAVGAMACAQDAHAATDLYRVELLVFRHGGGVTEPFDIDRLRGFNEAWPLVIDDTGQAPSGAPRGIVTEGTFANLQRRLERLGDYMPLAVYSWEQPAIEYQPPVRIHDDDVIMDTLYFPAEAATIDLTSAAPFQDHLAPLYRLDGMAQLRRSRFLHLELDIEWRQDAPVETNLPAPGDSPAEPAEDAGIDAEADTEALADEGPAPDPFKVHRLRQSRQVVTDTLIYFDSDVLGALARVTALAAE